MKIFSMCSIKIIFSWKICIRKNNVFEHLRQGTRTVREYELEFSRLRRFASSGMDEENGDSKMGCEWNVVADAAWYRTPA